MDVNRIQIGINQGRRVYQYFLPGSSPFHIFDDPAVRILIDFKTHLNDQRTYVIHLEMFYPKHADMLFSSYFEAVVEDRFIIEEGLLLPMAERSVDDFNATFEKLCSEANITFEKQIDLPGLAQEIVINLQENINSRISDAKSNKIFLESNGLHLTPGTRTNLFLRGTLMINDQLFMLSPNCDRLHNRDMLFEQAKIPFQRYLDLRIKCLQAFNEKTVFNFYETIILFNCTEIAVQILLNPNYDNIANDLMTLGLKGDRIPEYIKIATEIRKSVNEAYAKSKVDYRNTIPVIDWPVLLK
jgi:hypothetical protein